MTDMTVLRQRLFSLADDKYRKFHSGLCPGTDNIIGVRIPLLRKLVKEIAQEGDFLDFIDADTEYYEETMVQAMLIGTLKGGLDEVLPYIRRFIPKIDNWAVCDSFCAALKIAKKHRAEMLEFICPYLHSEHEFEVRFAVVMLLDHYITDEYIDPVIRLIDSVRHDGYYVKMAQAWALSVCCVKYRDKTLPYLHGENSLDEYTYKKTVSKIMESLRFTDNEKQYIRSFLLK